MGVIIDSAKALYEKNVFSKMLNNHSRLNEIDDIVVSYDRLVDQYNVIRYLNIDIAFSIALNEKKLVNKYTEEIRNYYSSKMNSFLSLNDMNQSILKVQELSSKLEDINSKHFQDYIDILKSDVSTILSSFVILYNDYHDISKLDVNKNNQSQDDDDPLYDEIVDYCIITGKVTASLIQRKFNLGYNRAARIVDILEERGIIGPANGSKPRDVLIKMRNDESDTEKSFNFPLINTGYFNKRKKEIVDNNNEEVKVILDENHIEEIQRYFDAKDINIIFDKEKRLNLEKVNNLLFANAEEKDVNDFVRIILSKTIPNNVRLVINDYSRISLLEYNAAPHLICPIVTDINKSEIAIQNVLKEMERRYDLFLHNKVKNIDSYYKLLAENKNLEHIPYYVVVFNEFTEILKNYDFKESVLLHLLLSCKKAGIIVIAFSKFNKKNIQLSMLEDLFEIHNDYSNKYFDFKEEQSIDKIKDIDDNMDGFDFEKYSKELLKENGFSKIEVTQASGDFGVDVIAYKDDIKYAIQCKKYSSPVGIKAVQEVIASKSMFNCHVAVVLTNNTFTKSAIELAEKNNVLLWDRKKLKELINNYENQKN